ncbi:MAG TPA: hypothetical protein VFZ21_17495 [Gemmatimonadaceae bacterium]|jgi:hypothetical protein|nr:hypothetical protein [Gemmatimonadaceae bacterium]
MTEPDQTRDAERLPEDAARRLLARASELEAARVTEMSVAELREAAREAGITPGAFEQALAELRAGDPAAAAGLASPRRRRPALLWPAALILGALLSILVLRMLFPAF